MTTGLDMIGNNKPLQEHWVRRFVAAIIDSIIIYIVIWVVFFFTPFYWLYFGTWGLLPGLVTVLYAGLMEGTSGATVGKRVMKLQVVSLMGELTVEKALIRNVSKVHGVLLLLDLIFGLATEGDPRQRYLDRIEQTTVVEAGALGSPVPPPPPPGAPYPPPGSVPPPPPPPQG